MLRNIKHLTILLFVLIYYKTVAQDVVFIDKVPTTEDLITISNHIGDSKSKLTFTKGFNATPVIAKINNTLIWRDTISTSSRLGVAIGINFDQLAKNVVLNIDGETISVLNYPEYRFIYLEKVNETFKITYQKKLNTYR